MYKSRSVFVLATVVIFTAALVLAGGGGNPNPRVLPPQSHPYGKTYGEWSAKWWQWAFSISVPNNPLLDTTGANIGEGQSGKVWFLAGTWGADPDGGSPHYRVGTVPAGKALFFPIFDAIYDNSNWGTGMTQEEWVNSPSYMTAAEMRAANQDWLDSIASLTCEVDGVAINGLVTEPRHASPYRCVSPDFRYYIPENSLWTMFGVDDTPRWVGAGMNPGEAAVADGIYLMLAPLSAGHHTIHFTVSDFLDVTYDLTVGG